MKHFLLVLLIMSAAIFLRWMRMGVGSLFRIRVDQQIGLFQEKTNNIADLLRVNYGTLQQYHRSVVSDDIENLKDENNWEGVDINSIETNSLDKTEAVYNTENWSKPEEKVISHLETESQLQLNQRIETDNSARMSNEDEVNPSNEEISSIARGAEGDGKEEEGKENQDVETVHSIVSSSPFMSKTVEGLSNEKEKEEEEDNNNGESEVEEENQEDNQEEEEEVNSTQPPQQGSNTINSMNDLKTRSNQQSLQSHSLRNQSGKQSGKPIKWLFLPEQSETAKQEQQRRFNQFLDDFSKRQSTLISEGRVVVYKIHKEAGLGNMVRGYLTALIIGMMTNRAVVFRVPRNFYFRFFIEPFPHMASLRLLGHNISTWEYFPSRTLANKLKSSAIDDWWPAPTLVLNTYSDLSSRFLRSEFYLDRLVKWGIVPSGNKPISAGRLGSLFRSAILPIIMRPQPYLCEVVQKHMKILREKKMIGIQMRLGGKKANYAEKLFLGPKSVNVFIKKIEKYIQQKGWKREDVVVFVSTDSTFALNEVKKKLNTPSYSMVYSANEFSIGHSALGKTLTYGDKQHASFLNRAILDLLLLKESDYLIYSQGSSFGLIAYELQQAYRYPVNATDYLRQHGMTCDVFSPRTSFGEASYVSKYKKDWKNE